MIIIAFFIAIKLLQRLIGNGIGFIVNRKTLIDSPFKSFLLL